MTSPSALSLLISNKNTFLSRYTKRRHWWFLVELPLSPNTVYDDIKPSKTNPMETDLTIKFLDSLSNTHHPNHLIRTFNEENYVFGYIHYPHTNVSKWKAAYDLKIFPRCIVSEAPTAKLKSLLVTEKSAISVSASQALHANLTSSIYKVVHASMGYAKGIDEDKLIAAMTNRHISTLQSQANNTTQIIIPPPSQQRRSHSHNPNREQKWEIFYNHRSSRPTTR